MRVKIELGDDNTMYLDDVKKIEIEAVESVEAIPDFIQKKIEDKSEKK